MWHKIQHELQSKDSSSLHWYPLKPLNTWPNHSTYIFCMNWRCSHFTKYNSDHNIFLEGLGLIKSGNDAHYRIFCSRQLHWKDTQKGEIVNTVNTVFYMFVCVETVNRVNLREASLFFFPPLLSKIDNFVTRLCHCQLNSKYKVVIHFSH